MAATGKRDATRPALHPTTWHAIPAMGVGSSHRAAAPEGAGLRLRAGGGEAEEILGRRRGAFQHGWGAAGDAMRCDALAWMR